jgi:hypothetical protein
LELLKILGLIFRRKLFELLLFFGAELLDEGIHVSHSFHTFHTVGL